MKLGGYGGVKISAKRLIKEYDQHNCMEFSKK